MPDSSVLMVDDTTSLISPWKSDVAKYANIISVVGGIEALARLRENPNICCAIINLSLKRVNGMDALIKIREKYPKLPVIILASLEDKAIIQNALNYSIQDLVPFPITSESLIEKLSKFLPQKTEPLKDKVSEKKENNNSKTTEDTELSGLKAKYYEAQSAFANSDFDKALKLFLEIASEKILKDSHLKYVEESYYQAGRCYIKKGDYNSAIEILKQFLTKAPKSLLTRQALFQIGTAYEYMGDKTKAINFYTKVISLQDTDSLASQAKKQIKKLSC